MTEQATSHPGEKVRLLLAERNMSQETLAERARVSRVGINQLVNGHRSMTPLMALKLSAVFGDVPPETFLEDQAIFDLDQVYKEHQPVIEAIRSETSA